ncbi:hypothetical protein [Haladaptatus sp. DFWS20]|uniref:hypothetical protein n=1 Tax=Haladaptatus sp. DFWS20 TaxID=3403467 RepID=UPI003EBA272D
MPTPDYPVIEWPAGRRARFSITDSNSKDATLKTYRYTADQVAPTIETYGRQLRDRYSFTISGLVDAERKLVERATEGHGYNVERGNAPSDAFRSLVELFRQQEAVDD